MACRKQTGGYKRGSRETAESGSEEVELQCPACPPMESLRSGAPPPASRERADGAWVGPSAHARSEVPVHAPSSRQGGRSGVVPKPEERYPGPRHSKPQARIL